MTVKRAALVCALGILCCLGNGWLGTHELHAQVAAPIYPIKDSDNEGVVVEASHIVEPSHIAPPAAIIDMLTVQPESVTNEPTRKIDDQTRLTAVPAKRVPAKTGRPLAAALPSQFYTGATENLIYTGATENLSDFFKMADNTELDSAEMGNAKMDRRDPVTVDIVDLKNNVCDSPICGPSCACRTGGLCDGNYCPYGCGAGMCDCALPCCKKRIPLFYAGGWVSAGISYNSLRPVNPAAGRGNIPVGFNYRTDNIQLNQAYVYVEKPIDTSCGWSLGGRVDAFWGEDYFFAESIGLERHQNGNEKWNGDFDGNGINNSNRIGLALPQAYLELGCGCLSAKVGHFYTPIGYESVMAPGNFFYSHTNAMFNGEPFTHTGILSKWQLSPDASLFGGIHNGWNVWWRNNGNFGGALTSNHNAFIGGMSLSSCNKAVQVAAMVTSGRELDGQRADSFSTRTLYSVVGKVQITPRLGTVIHHDWAVQLNGDQRTGGNAEWYGVSSYVFYKLNCCCDFGIRYEWFNDQNGFTIVGPAIGQTGFGSHFHAFTMGFNWRPCKSIAFRPELRWDWQAFHDAAGQQPVFDRQDPVGPQNSQFMAAMDCVIRF